MDLETLKKLLLIIWDNEDCSYVEYSAVISLIVNDMFGGKIMMCFLSSGSHYYNLIDGKIVDLTVEHFSGKIPQYETSEERTRDYLLSNEEIKNRYEKLLYNLKQSIRRFHGKKFILTDCNGKEYLSDVPGTFGGNRRLKIYGRLDCSSAKRWIEKGYYVKDRVFFIDEETAICAGYRPCAKCMPDKYRVWKNGQLKEDESQFSLSLRLGQR